MRIRPTRTLGAIALAVGLVALAPAPVGLAPLAPAPAAASTTMISMLEDQPSFLSNPQATMAQLHALGVNSIRLLAVWDDIAPNANSPKEPAHFNATNPAAYPAAKWAPIDDAIIAAEQYGIAVDLDLQGGAPRWATGPGMPKGDHHNWEPSPRLFGQFVRAVGARYSGSYTPRGAAAPLPRVSFWSIWNEPDYGPSLAPQGLPGHLTIEYSPLQYRRLLDTAWNALMATRHGHDTIIFGEVAPRGADYWGVFSGMKPIHFIQMLYCLDSHYHALRGTAARLRGCPTTPGGSKLFPVQNPALFRATGFADHPYMRWYPPNDEEQPDPLYSSLGEIGVLERALNRLTAAYGSHKHFPIYDTEFGYITTPPKHDNQIEPNGKRDPWVSQATAAYYLNWAEYISWKDPRIATFNQYLLQDALPSLKTNDWGGFASGLINFNGKPKPTYAAWRMPLYLPKTSGSLGSSLEVWGCVRPAPFAALDEGVPQTADIQFQPSSGGPYTTAQTITITSSSGCYFDVHIPFASSGNVQVRWTYPVNDPLLAQFAGQTVTSRVVKITLH